MKADTFVYGEGPPESDEAPGEGTALYSGASLFVLTFAVFMVFFGGHYVSGDNAQRIAWAKALLKHGSNDISGYMPGIRDTKYGIGTSLLHMPFLIVAREVQSKLGISVEGPVNMLLYELNAAAAITLVYLILTRRLGISRTDAFYRSLAIGLGTIWIVYSKCETSEALVVTLLLAVVAVGEQHPYIAGLLGGFAIAVRSDSVVWLSLTVLCTLRTFSVLWRVVVASIPGFGLTLGSNYGRTGSLFNSGYEVDFSTPLLSGVYGLLFSAGKSVFLFSPLLLLFIPAALESWRTSDRRWLTIWATSLVIGQLCFFGKWWDWSGDDAWGPRLVIFATMAALIVIAASSWARSRWFWALAVAGGLLQLPPLLMGPFTTLMIDHTRQVTKFNEWTKRAEPVTLEDMRFDPAYSQVTDTIELLLLKSILANDWLNRSQWLSGMTPPLGADEVTLDILWLHPRLSSASRASSAR